MKRKIGILGGFFNMLMIISCFIAVISLRTSNLVDNEFSNGNIFPQLPVSAFSFDHHVIANDDLITCQNSTGLSCGEDPISLVTLILLPQSSCFQDVIWQPPKKS